MTVLQLPEYIGVQLKWYPNYMKYLVKKKGIDPF